jgi:TusA-related sulfurtransferase
VPNAYRVHGQEHEKLEIRSDDEGAHADVPAWCEQTGNEFLGQEPAAGYFRYYVRKKVG